MRVFVVEPLGKGGLLHYSYHLCRGLQRAGVNVTLVTATHYELDNLPHEFKLVKLLHLWDPRQAKSDNPLLRRLQRVKRGISYFWQWLRLVRYLRHEKPDVVLFGEMRFAFEALFLQRLRKAGLKLADIVHDVRPYETNQQSDVILKEDEKSRAQYNHTYQLFSALFVHDQSNYDLFLSLYDVPKERVHKIVHATSELMLEVPQQYSTTELKTLLNIPDSEPIILFFGTLTKYKGIEDLIEAFPLVRKELASHLVIAGFPAKDIDVKVLQQKANAHGMADHITWYTDYVPNEWVATLMELSDVVVLPYRAITQSGILQIAYACGKPIVATRVGGLPDAIVEGETGFLAEANNPASLAQALVRSLQSPEATSQMGVNAKHLAETHYTWLSVAEQIKRVFETLA